MHCCVAVHRVIALHCVVFSALFSVALRLSVGIALYSQRCLALRRVVRFSLCWLALRCVLALHCVIFSVLASGVLHRIVFSALVSVALAS